MIIAKIETHAWGQPVAILHQMTTHVLSLGAIHKITGNYVYPKMANKRDKYICQTEMQMCENY